MNRRWTKLCANTFCKLQKDLHKLPKDLHKPEKKLEAVVVVVGPDGQFGSLKEKHFLHVFFISVSVLLGRGAVSCQKKRENDGKSVSAEI